MADDRTPQPPGERAERASACPAARGPWPGSERWPRMRMRLPAADDELRRLRLSGVVVPLLFIGAAEAIRVEAFPQTSESVASLALFFGIVAAGALVFSTSIFGTVRRLHEQVLAQSRRLAALSRIALASAERPGLEDLLDTALEQALAVVSADAGLVCAVDLSRGEHSALAARGFSDELLRGFRRLPLRDDPIASKVVATGQPVAVECLLDDPQIAELAAREGVLSSISVPLKAQGEVAGVLAIATRSERQFSDGDREFLLGVASQLALAIKQAAAFERAVRTARELEALLTVGGAANASLSLSDVLDPALDAVLAVTSAEVGEIWLAGDDGLELAGQRGSADTPRVAPHHLAFGEGVPGRVAQERSAVAVHDAGAGELLVAPSAAGAGIASYVAVPLVHRGRLLGVLAVAGQAADSLSEREELRLLDGIAEILAVAIDNAHLYQRVQDEAVLEERERLAREMHDGLAQVLTYVNAQSIAISKHLHADRPLEAIDELESLQRAVRDLYGDVREAILGLRASPSLSHGIIETTRSYLVGFERISSIRTELHVDPSAEAIPLRPAEEIQLIRIVQEALSNARTHSGADLIAIRFQLADGGLRIAVEDDGCGFDPADDARHDWPRFGLQTMRERAEAIGGTFRVRSRPGHGTAVVVELPCKDAASAAPVSAPARSFSYLARA